MDTKKINKEVEDLNNIQNTVPQYTYTETPPNNNRISTSAHEVFLRVKHLLGHKSMNFKRLKSYKVSFQLQWENIRNQYKKEKCKIYKLQEPE